MFNKFFGLKFKWIKLMRVLWRAILLVTMTAIMVTVFYFDHKTERLFFTENYILLDRGLSDDGFCELPLNVDPFDESLFPFIKTLPKRVECEYESDSQNNLTFIDSSGILRQTSLQYKCKYRFFYGLGDYEIVYKKKRVLNAKKGIPMNNKNFVGVECYDMSSRRVYENTHFWFPMTNNSENSEESHPKGTAVKPSVLILVIESLSRINFLRFMSKTRRSFESYGNTVYLKGLTKMADNSFPNMVPFLTGKRVNNKELKDEEGPFDNWTFIWKDFSKAGYKTALVEDFPEVSLFNYYAEGFVRKPCDWYPRPFWIHSMGDNINHETNRIIWSDCYIKRFPKIDIFLKQIKHFIEKCDSRRFPYFAFAFNIEVTHNNFNRAQQIDSHVSHFLEQMRDQLNNTILILMGDHGSRFGPALRTVIGRIEERMPLFAIRIPDQMNRTFPHLLPTLESNSEKLVNWLDLHQMLTDIPKQNYSLIESSPEQRTYSPWRQSIPSSRTCTDALIPGIYCVCNNRQLMNISNPMVRNASLSLIDTINGFLPPNKCHKLSLDSSLSAELILPNNSTAKPKGFEIVIEITVSAKPSDAIFRAQLIRRVHIKKWLVREDINRINKYGDQSKCIRNRRLKPFCFCI